MPNSKINLHTEINSYPKALVIDEGTDLSLLLVDSLLKRGCQVSYFSNDKEKDISYLKDRSEFIYIDNKNVITELDNFDYLFYFSLNCENNLFEGYLHDSRRVKKILILNQQCFSKEIELILNSDNFSQIKVLLYGEIYGPRILNGVIADTIKNIITNNNGIINREETDSYSLLFSEKFISEILRIIFSSDTKGNIYLAEGDYVDSSTLVFYLKRLFPEIEFKFNNNSKNNLYFPDRLLTIQIKDNIIERLEETVDWFKRSWTNISPIEKRPEEIIANLDRTREITQSILSSSIIDSNSLPSKEEVEILFSPVEEEKPAKTVSKKILFGVFIFLILIISFFTVPILISGFFGVRGFSQLIYTGKQLGEGKGVNVEQRLDKANKNIVLAQKITNLSVPFYGLIGNIDSLDKLSNVWLIGDYLINSLKAGYTSGKIFSLSFKKFINNEEVPWLEDISEVEKELTRAYEQSSLAQSLLDQVKEQFVTLRRLDYFERLKSDLPLAREMIVKARGVMEVFPEIIGINKRKTYLLLFQNNMELRPTGGFIGSFGIVNLENGKLVSFDVYDVYQADGQLKGHIEPPAKFKEYLGEANWYLRDSNWDPNFPTSAKRALWFLDKEMQIAGDGVIAINLEAIRKILIATGPIELLDYQEKISADNLFQKAEYYSELGTFPGSTQKKDFLGSLAKALFEKYRTAKEDDLLLIGKEIFDTLQEKDVLLYFNEEKAQKNIGRNNWAGEILSYQDKYQDKPVVADYLYINEANVGVDKANYFVKRQVDQSIDIDETGFFKGRLKITYENTSPSESWPAGIYKNYLRVYLPLQANIDSIMISSIENIDLWQSLGTSEAGIYEENGKKVVELLVEVPIKSFRKLEISYNLSTKADLSKKVNTYLLMVQKQSGAYPSTYTLSVKYPPNLVPVRVLPSAVVANQELLIIGKMDKDQVFQFDFAR